MSDTPETDVATFDAGDGQGWEVVSVELARRLERERNKAEAGWCECRDFAQRMVDERDEQTAQMCQAIGHLSTVAEDCEAWLNGESYEPSMDFIKAVRDYARKAVNNG